MKPLLICSVLLGASVAANAQTPVGSRALTKTQIKSAEWPSFQTGTSAVYAPQYVALQFLLRNQGFFKGKPQEDLTEANSLVLTRGLKAFQRAKNLKVDGVVGSQTWGKLCPRLNRGDRGDAVRAFQTLLNYENDDANALKVDGIFGFTTETALRKYQKSVEMYVDGIAGAQMWSYLLSPPEGGD